MLGSDGDIDFAAIDQCERLVNDHHTLAMAACKRIYHALNNMARAEDTLAP